MTGHDGQHEGQRDGRMSETLLALWEQLERLQVGIGSWMVTAATMPRGTPADDAEFVAADDAIRDLLERAVAVKGEITARLPPRPLPRQARPVGATPPGGVGAVPAGPPPAPQPPTGVPARPDAWRDARRVVVTELADLGGSPRWPLTRRTPGANGPAHRAD